MWIVIDEWVEVPGLWTIPHTVPDRILVGGPSNAGALFVDWARKMLAGLQKHGAVAQPPRSGDPQNVPVWLPYLRGERAPFHDPDLRSSVHDLDITSTPLGLERAAYEASGFVVRRMLDMAGVEPRRIVASGGGSRVPSLVRGDRRRNRGPGGRRGCSRRCGTRSVLSGSDGGRPRDRPRRSGSLGEGRSAHRTRSGVGAAARERYARFLDCLPFDPGAARPKRG